MTVLRTQQTHMKPKSVGTRIEEVSSEQRAEAPEGAKVVEQSEQPAKAQPSAEQLARRNRRSRSPIDGRRNILTVKGLAPGMVGRWVDNTPERVDQLLEQGYDFVRENVQVGDISIDSGAQMGAVKTKRVGGGKESILMQIPKEWYDADQTEKQKRVDIRETTIYSEGKTGNFYGSVKASDIVPGKRPTRRDSGE